MQIYHVDRLYAVSIDWFIHSSEISSLTVCKNEFFVNGMECFKGSMLLHLNFQCIYLCNMFVNLLS